MDARPLRALLAPLLLVALLAGCSPSAAPPASPTPAPPPVGGSYHVGIVKHPHPAIIAPNPGKEGCAP